MENEKIEKLLDELGIKVNQCGYSYWITALQIYYKNKEATLEEIYDKVAKEHNATSMSVKTAMRRTYENKIEESKIQSYFNVDYKITNSILLNLLMRELERSK